MKNGDTKKGIPESIRWLAIFMAVATLAALQPAFGHVQWHSPQRLCPSSRDDFVRLMLPSITKYLIVTADQFDGVPVDPLEFSLGKIGKLLAPVPDNTQPSGFRIARIHLESNELTRGAEPMAFSGHDLDRANSFATFFIEPRNLTTGSPAYLGGFLIEDVAQEADLNNRDDNNWFFYEPVRPLLERIVQAMRPGNPCMTSDVERFFPMASEMLNSSIILYEARDTDFLMDLDPYDVGSSTGHAQSIASIRGSLEPSHVSRFMASQAPTGCGENRLKINLLPVADSKYYDLFPPRDGVQETNLQRAKIDITNLMTLFTYLGPETNFYCSYGADVNFVIREPEIWETAGVRSDAFLGRGPGDEFTSAPNAYQLLCDLVNNAVHTDTFDANPTIVHLMSGWDLDLFPRDQGNTTDFGDTFCQAGCGGDGRVIVGLAEQIGGFRNATTSACGAFPYDQIIPIETPGHHSVSQHAPKTRDEIATRNMDGTLFQRWALMAHEIGHNLGAKHRPVDPATPMQSVMVSKINGRLKYYLAPESAQEINVCLASSTC